MSELREYVGPDGVSTFGRWFNVLDGVAAAKIAIVLARLGEGNTSHLKGVGGGVAELRVHFGPGYRIYLGVDSPELMILLRGGDKKTQSSDIRRAQRDWRTYKMMKKQAPE